jgi:hypothetical protein
MRKCIGGLVFFGLWAGLAITAAWGQDFQKNYSLAPGGAINIANVSGEISISGYNGKRSPDRGPEHSRQDSFGSAVSA